MIKVAAFMFILALVSSACTWLMGSDRSQAVACYDGAGPRILGNFSAKLGTPVNVNFLSGLPLDDRVHHRVGTDLGERGFRLQRDDRRRFDVHNDLLHPDLPVPWRSCVGSHPDVHRPYRVPGGMTGRVGLH